MSTNRWKRAPLSQVVLCGLACGLMVGGMGYLTAGRDLPAAVGFGALTAVCVVVIIEVQYRRHGV